jgi:RNA polymerase sigma factor (sigma-70 family)
MSILADAIASPSSFGDRTAGLDCSVTAALVARSREGCHEAYRELVERHRDRIFRYCLGWSGSPEDAEELCQDVFVRAYSALPRYRDEGRFLAWLYTIARNRCRDLGRKRAVAPSGRHRSLASVGEESLVCPAPGPDRRTADSEELGRLLEAVAALPERLREAVILCGIEGMPQEDVAALLGCSVRAVEGRLYRARRELAENWDLASETAR